MTRRALITGITGQDGSYLAELLLDKGYEVVGMVRRSSTVNFERIGHLQDRLTLVPGDLLDEISLVGALNEHRPQEVYNLAAQSFVQTSFGQPVLTGETTALGVTRLLDAVRLVDPTMRIYQASSSEMFGKVVEVPQRESTPFYPRSPYGVAKVYGHWITVNYRESYDLHASSGILFNHESVPARTPVIVRRKGIIDILPIEDVVPHRTDPSKGRRHTSDGGDLEVWDGTGFVPCTARTAHWHEGESVTLHGRGASVTTTADHVVMTPDDPDGERAAGAMREGERLVVADVPPTPWATTLTSDEAWLLGLLAADGWIAADGGHGRITNGDDVLLGAAGERWASVTGGSYRKWEGGPSAFSDRRIPAVDLHGASHHLRLYRHELYTRNGLKKVPTRVLNASTDLQEAFLIGCYAGDGLKAGHGTDPFRSFRTTSDALAAGLVWIARTALGRRASIYRQPGTLGGGHSWLVDLSSGQDGARGRHLRRDPAEIRSVERHDGAGWMFDLATTSGRFAAGVGPALIHNSPRRGLEFVTRKISHGVAQIAHGAAQELRLGNLDAQRDWGFAGDYVEAMWLMLQQDEPGDFVVSTGETHAVREFCELAFGHAGLDWERHVVVDDRFFRPAEVELLVGDASRARDVLGWEPRTPFPELVRMMVDADLALVERQLRER